jgi:hypothetical protein
MKNTLQTITTNYIKHRHSDNACSKSKRRVNLKSSILRQQNRFIIKIRSYFKKLQKKRWDENNSKMQY